MSQSEEGTQDNWSKLRHKVVSENVDPSLIEIPKKVMKLWRKNFAEGQRRGDTFEAIFDEFNRELQDGEIKYEPSKNHFEGLYDILQAKKARFINQEIESLKGFVGEEMVKSLDQYLKERGPNTRLTREIVQQYMESPYFRAQVGVEEGSFLKRHSSQNSSGHNQDAKSLPNTIDSFDEEFGISEDERAKIEADFIKMVSTPDGVEQMIRKRYRRMVLMDATSGLGDRFKEVDSELVARMDESISFPKNVDLSLVSVRQSLGHTIKTVLSKDKDLKEKIDALRKSMTEIEQKESAIASWKKMSVQFKEDFNTRHNLEDTDEARKVALEQCSKEANILLQNYKELMKGFTPEIMTKAIVESANFLAFKRDFVLGLKSCGVSLNTADHKDLNYMKTNRFLQDNSSKIKEFQAQGGTAEDLANMLTSISKKKIVSDKTWEKLADNLNQQVQNASPIFHKVFSELEEKGVKLSKKDKKLIQDKLAKNIAGLLKSDEKGSNVGHIQEMLVREIENVGKRSKLQNEAIINYINTRMTEGNLEIYTSGFSAIAKQSGRNMDLDQEKIAHGLFEQCSKGLEFDEDAKKALMADFISQYNPTKFIEDGASLGKRVLESSLIIHKALEKNKEALLKAQVEITPQFKRIIHSKLIEKVMALSESFSVDDIEGFISQKISKSLEQVKGDKEKAKYSSSSIINYLENPITKEELESHVAIEYNPADHTPPPLEAINLKAANAEEFIEIATEDLDFENNPEIKEQIVEKFGSMLDVMRDNVPENKLQALAEAFSDALLNQMDMSSTEVFKNGIDESRIISSIEEKIPELKGKYKHVEAQTLQDTPPPLEAIYGPEEIDVDIEIAKGIILDSLGRSYEIDESRAGKISRELAPMVIDMQNMIAEKQLMEGEKINAFLVEALDKAFESQISALNSGKSLNHNAIRESIEGQISTQREERKNVRAREMSFRPIGESDPDLAAAKVIIKNSLNEFSFELSKEELTEICNEFAPVIVEMQDKITRENLLNETPVNEFLETIFANAIEDQDFGFGGVANYKDLSHQEIQNSLERVISDLRERKKKTQAQSSGRDSTDSGIDRGDGTPEPPEVFEKASKVASIAQIQVSGTSAKKPPKKRDILNEVKRGSGLGKPRIGKKISSIINKMRLETQKTRKISGADGKRNHRSPGIDV